ncbi:Flavin-dependent oxidoreductase, F420-dependent methylene-tetrahydromethanopterin reductase (fragment) [metagenome]|uniref:Flavin-dependent oxidoreductase, F420-dependent methylene-tetrahydromethanopterin reductase n=1 Tax=metagenome TaxID=256318 RepID=A0A2P2C5Q7_9ZZZZ
MTLGIQPTPDDGVRLSTRRVWDESTRPPPTEPDDREHTDNGRAVAGHLVQVHDHLRAELAQVRSIVEQVRAGSLDLSRARSHINEMTMRQNAWTMGAYCASYCRLLTQHHSLEDSGVFPHLSAADPRLEPVVDRLMEEHVVIHEVLEGLDAALVAHVAAGDDFTDLDEALDLLTDTLLSHLSYEERVLLEPLARHGMY